MPQQTQRDATIVRYLSEAYANERRLEGTLETHIGATTRADYLKRLKQHLKETRSHATEVKRRIGQLGGDADVGLSLESLNRGADAAQAVIQRATDAVKKPIKAVMGPGEQARMLKNARTEYEDEAREIATYQLIEGLASAVGDKETAKLARKILREEQRMSEFLGSMIPLLAIDVAHDEIPVAEIEGQPAARRTATATSRPTTRSRSGSTSSKARSKSSK